MPVYKDGKSGWRVVYRYTDFRGELKQTQKRGFKTQREAKQWEHEQILKTEASLDMTFGSFVEIFAIDKQERIKESTWANKEHIIRTKILPYFKDRKIAEIQPRDVIAWQNEMLHIKQKNGKPLSPDYLRNLHTQLSCIFNHAVRYYGLKSNPAKIAGSMGKKGAKEMLFWTQEEYRKFAEAMMDKPVMYYAFEMLYWCGIRCGELLALTPADFDFEQKKLRINKSYQRLNGRDLITDPKTKKSIRTIDLPEFLVEEIRDYLKMLYGIKGSDRMFAVSKHSLHRAMDFGAKEAGVKRIRVHDLRHSHVSLLIQLGYSAVAIADRLGHESIEITYRYAHMFPSVQQDMAKSLDTLRKEEEDVSEES